MANVNPQQLTLPISAWPPVQPPKQSFLHEVRDFQEFGEATRLSALQVINAQGKPIQVPVFINEFWTSKQRAANALHEISYRACFKPQLPRFFIERLTAPGESVYDPFMGRGTTLVEGALLGRIPSGCDVNPLSVLMVRPRLSPPTLEEVEERLQGIDLDGRLSIPEELCAFYHPDTLKEICSLKNYFKKREKVGSLDTVDDWIRMVAINRLTGHSPGFFSVYTMPPNQAVSLKSQRKINERRNQTPPRRHVKPIILKKSKQLLSDCTEDTRATLNRMASRACLLTGPSHDTKKLKSNSVQLVVTSPPFLNIVDYATDNWLRCWFAEIDPKTVKLTVPKKLETWQEAMTLVFKELHRILKPGGHIAFEVGELDGGALKLEDAVLPCGIQANLTPLLVLINAQEFTKTANCWGVDNNAKGTNTNRIVLFRKD